MTDRISLALGTVQLGMPYGIANSSGKPSIAQASQILSAAADLGIEWIDTARAYGDAEAVIGAWLAGRSGTGDPAIATKIAPLGADGADPVAELEASVEASCNALRTGRLELVLLHRPGDMFRAGVYERLAALKQTGKCQQIGVSVYDPGDARAILDRFAIDAIQYPANLLDRRFALSGLAEDMRANGITTFVRSVYLQGLLALPVDRVPKGFEALLPLLHRLEELALSLEVTRQALLLGFAARDTLTDYLVVGAEQEDQLRATHAACQAVSAVPERVWAELSVLSNSVPGWISDPRQWAASGHRQ